MTKSPNHAEEGELAEVEDCSGRKRPCEEEDHRGGRARVKSEESLESHFEMVVNCIKLLHAKHNEVATVDVCSESTLLAKERAWRSDTRNNAMSHDPYCAWFMRIHCRIPGANDCTV